MKLQDVIDELSLTIEAGAAGMETDVTGAYAADLLSCAMAGADQGDLWLTLQGHLNIVAIASLAELAGIVVTEGKPVSPDTLSKADEEGIPILTTPMNTYEVAGRLWELGIRT